MTINLANKTQADSLDIEDQTQDLSITATLRIYGQFNFYMVPYSMLEWYQQKRNGTFDGVIYSAETAAGEILKNSIAKVHFFQDEKDIITNLDLYRDYTHFKPEINGALGLELFSDEIEV